MKKNEKRKLWKQGLGTALVCGLAVAVFPAAKADAADLLKAGPINTTAEHVTQNQPFAERTAGSQYFRIPAFIVTQKGNLLAAADARYSTTGDGGGLDTIASVSTDNGKTGNSSFPLYFPDSEGYSGTSATTIIDPALVQGEQAAESIAEGIRTLDEKNLDVLIVGRGGGSMEDLWAFNEEPVIEAVFAAKTPVISAVGHETDFTITDFVADLRAPTPSAAAELAVCDISAIEAQIAAYEKALYTAAVRKISDSKNVLENYRLRLAVFNPVSRIEDGRQYTMQAEERLEKALYQVLAAKRHQMELLAARLNGVSPLAKLGQGYAYVSAEDGTRIRSTADVAEKSLMKIYLKDGYVKAQALEVTHGKGTDA